MGNIGNWGYEEELRNRNFGYEGKFGICYWVTLGQFRIGGWNSDGEIRCRLLRVRGKESESRLVGIQNRNLGVRGENAEYELGVR
jgi:hypothetical protein